MVDRTGGTFFGPNDYRRSLGGMASWIYELIEVATVSMWALSSALSTEGLERARDQLREHEAETGHREAIVMPDQNRFGHVTEVLPAVDYFLAQRTKNPHNYDTGAMSMHLGLMLAIAQLADAIDHFGFRDRYNDNKALRFLFHLRNAFAHGSVWSFHRNVDFAAKPAEANNFSLDLSMNGKQLWSVIGPGDVYALLEELLNFFLAEAEAEEAAAPSE